MTFHAPRSRSRVISLVLRRSIASRTTAIATGAFITATAVLADRGENEPLRSFESSALPDAMLELRESLALRQLRLPAWSPETARTAVEVSASGRIARPRAPSPIPTDLRTLTRAGGDTPPPPVRDAAPVLKTDLPASPLPSVADALPGDAFAAAHDAPDALPEKLTRVASLTGPGDIGDLHAAFEPRFPPSRPVAIVPAVARLPEVDTEVGLDFLGHGPVLTTLRAAPEERFEALLERSGMLPEDRRATLVALRADAIDESLSAGDAIDIAFLAEDDRDVLAIRLRQAGRDPVELRWDGETEPLWAAIDEAERGSAAAPEIAEIARRETPRTMSITGKPDDNVYVSGSIESSLYQSAAAAGLRPKQTKALEEIFRYSVDFERDLRKGDRFEALIEKRPDGSHGDILYAKLTNRGSEIALYRGTDDATGTTGYFDATGKTNKRSLMRTPVAGARVSSHFGMRLHPILGYNKMHRGTDFRAPRGTPIYAAGDGIVDYIGRNGAYGEYIRLRHNGQYQTAYAHLSRYAHGLRQGDRVRQGDVIGYVGSTGRSTGPHLHFEIHENGIRIDPMQIADFGPVKGLEGPGLTRFLVRVSRIEVALSLMQDDTRVAEAE